VLASVLGQLIATLFPARCIGCSIRGTALCAPCRRELPYLPDEVCGRCAARRGARGVCWSWRLSPRLGTIHAALAYEGAARSAVLTLKFQSGRYLVPLMGELLRAELARRPVRAEAIVPVPLAPARLRQRGYNQALLLACEVAATVGGVVVPEALRREDRPAQRMLAAAERLRNLEGAVTCGLPDMIFDRRVLLIDDVVTTGATLSACAEALAEAGARRVSALAFARDL
jgi:competence protein ComFC